MISILLLIKLDIAIAMDINIDIDQNPPLTGKRLDGSNVLGVQGDWSSLE